MVKVAVAGANSGLALEVIEKIVEHQEHEVLALCRRDPADFPRRPGVTWAQTSFGDKAEMVKLLHGVDVVLSFIVITNDPGNKSQMLLVDAAVEAGVKRFAPSEWAMSQKLYEIIDVVPWYQGKLDMQAYLKKVNREKKILEYCFFQVGIFMEYSANPRELLKHVPAMATVCQFDDCRIVAVKGYENDPITLTSVKDIAAVVKRAIEYEGEWPEVGGMSGTRASPVELKELVEKIRDQPVKLDLVDEEDIKAGILKVEMPELVHPSIPAEERPAWHAPGWNAILTAAYRGAWTVTDEWNKLLPDYNFTTVDQFVKNTWIE